MPPKRDEVEKFVAGLSQAMVRLQACKEIDESRSLRADLRLLANHYLSNQQQKIRITKPVIPHAIYARVKKGKRVHFGWEQVTDRNIELKPNSVWIVRDTVFELDSNKNMSLCLELVIVDYIMGEVDRIEWRRIKVFFDDLFFELCFN